MCKMSHIIRHNERNRKIKTICFKCNIQLEDIFFILSVRHKCMCFLCRRNWAWPSTAPAEKLLHVPVIQICATAPPAPCCWAAAPCSFLSWHTKCSSNSASLRHNLMMQHKFFVTVYLAGRYANNCIVMKALNFPSCLTAWLTQFHPVSGY